jgi:UDP-N-acetylglucosamine 2-epimerase (non-hydrolysing)
MKIATVCGTRPEVIRLSRVIPKLDALCEHVLIHTGQSYDANMRDVFFEELGLRAPDTTGDVRGLKPMQQVGCMMAQLEERMILYQPDRILILGDTNSALAAAYVAKRRGVPVYHMEAGNRCFDDRVPEEVNRRIIDHTSDVHMPYTERARANLLREGIPSHDIYVTGNPIGEVIGDIANTPALTELSVIPQGYFLVTAHREENVDQRYRLTAILATCVDLILLYEMPVIFSRHPRTAKRMQEWDLAANPERGIVLFHEPFGLRDFLTLEEHAYCVLTDSGTVQEECCLLRVPCVTLRDVTERPETVECGSTILAGVEPVNVLQAVKVATQGGCDWIPPDEYLRTDVSDAVVRIVLGV